MGMYDYVKCEYPLPGTPSEDVRRIALAGEMQTKSFAWKMNTYTITKAGRLMHSKQGVLKTETFVPVDENFSGVITFYTIDKDGMYYECEAKFVDCNLVAIREIDA